MKQQLTEGMIDNFIRGLTSKFSDGVDLRSISPELDQLADKDPELRKTMKDLQKASLSMKKFIKGYRKRNPEIAKIADTIPKGF